jgi:hypothetical protein
MEAANAIPDRPPRVPEHYVYNPSYVQPSYVAAAARVHLPPRSAHVFKLV